MSAAPILVGFVDSPEGQAALDAAVEQAHLTGAPMIVVASHKGGAALASPEALALEKLLAKVRGQLAEAGVEFDVRALVRGNDVSEDLVDLAVEHHARLIVIGLRKRSPVGKLILGSNSQQILLEAPCAVLAVKAR
ncbi:MAG TPA: universal stress protein [Candidatus Nanopelagicales bacterium]|jgi:nucleotide-binding universal stress UspA family protein|nr:universal stress protein [Candidatus Nanopelagicales bacterium]